MRKKVVLGIAFALVLAFATAMVGCASGSSSASASSASASASSASASSESASASSASASSSAAAADLAPIAVSYLNKAGYEDIIVADNQGFYKDCGTEVTLLPVTGSGQQSVEALLAGQSDIAATGQGPVADAIKQYGDDIIVLAGTNISTGGQVWVAGAGLTGDAAITPYDPATDNKADVKASFEAAAAAKGGTIKCGIQQGATTESEFKKWLKAFDISFNDFGAEGDGTVTLVDLKANTIPTALATGEDIDMMAASQPYPDTALASIEGSYKIGANSDINSYSVMCLITTKDVFAEKEDSIKAFLEAEKESVDFMNGNADEAIKICADSIGTDVDSVKAQFDIANFKVDMSDQMISVLQKACKGKEVEITEDQLKAQMPLIEWLNGTLNK